MFVPFFYNLNYSTFSQDARRTERWHKTRSALRLAHFQFLVRKLRTTLNNSSLLDLCQSDEKE